MAAQSSGIRFRLSARANPGGYSRWWTPSHSETNCSMLRHPTRPLAFSPSTVLRRGTRSPPNSMPVLPASRWPLPALIRPVASRKSIAFCCSRTPCSSQSPRNPRSMPPSTSFCRSRNPPRHRKPPFPRPCQNNPVQNAVLGEDRKGRHPNPPRAHPPPSRSKSDLPSKRHSLTNR